VLCKKNILVLLNCIKTKGMLTAIKQQIFELLLTRINLADREIKLHGRHVNRVNRHVEENRERVRHEH